MKFHLPPPGRRLRRILTLLGQAALCCVLTAARLGWTVRPLQVWRRAGRRRAGPAGLLSPVGCYRRSAAVSGILQPGVGAMPPLPCRLFAAQ